MVRVDKEYVGAARWLTQINELEHFRHSDTSWRCSFNLTRHGSLWVAAYKPERIGLLLMGTIIDQSDLPSEDVLQQQVQNMLIMLQNPVSLIRVRRQLSRWNSMAFIHLPFRRRFTKLTVSNHRHE